MEQFIIVGQIINTHGVKGELKIFPMTDDLKRFKKLKKIYIDGEEKIVSWCKLQADRVILKLEGIETMDDAQKLKTKHVYVSREDAVKLPEGRYFVADIMGCTVVDTEGTELGKVDEVIFTGSNEVYWIKKPKELLIPVIEDVVVDIDVENEKITIKPVKEWQDE